MSWAYVDDDLERQLHQGFTGRQGVRDELAGLLLGDGVDRRVALIGRSGIGKTATVTSWAAQCEAARELVFCHFVRTQHGDRAEPRVIAGALASQIERRFPRLRNPYARPEPGSASCSSACRRRS